MEMPDYLSNISPALQGSEKKMLLWGARMTVLLFAVSLTASTITYNASGTFNSSTPSSAYSGPDETWSLSFDVNSTPVVSNVDAGGYFDAAFSDFSYSLDGVAVAITPVDIRFFSALDYGGFDICFTIACQYFNSPTDGIEIETSQLFTGSESAPTMSAGNFPWIEMSLFVDSSYYPQVPPGTGSVEALATPEPSSILMLGSGLLLALAGRRPRRP
jgi:hypothetical protein